MLEKPRAEKMLHMGNNRIMPIKWPYRLISRGEKRKLSIRANHRNPLSVAKPRRHLKRPLDQLLTTCMLPSSLLGNHSEIRGLLLDPELPNLPGWSGYGNMHLYICHLDIYSPKKPHLEIWGVNYLSLWIRKT